MSETNNYCEENKWALDSRVLSEPDGNITVLPDSVYCLEEQRFTLQLLQTGVDFALGPYSDITVDGLPHIDRPTIQALIRLQMTNIISPSLDTYVFKGAVLFSGLILIAGEKTRLITPLGQYNLMFKYRKMDMNTLLTLLQEVAGGITYTNIEGVGVQITSVGDIVVPTVEKLYLYDSTTSAIEAKSIGEDLWTIYWWVDHQLKRELDCAQKRCTRGSADFDSVLDFDPEDCGEYITFAEKHPGVLQVYFPEVVQEWYDYARTRNMNKKSEFERLEEEFVKRIAELEQRIVDMSSPEEEAERLRGVTEGIRNVVYELLGEERFEEAEEVLIKYTMAVRKYQDVQEEVSKVVHYNNAISRATIEYEKTLQRHENEISESDRVVEFWGQFVDV